VRHSPALISLLAMLHTAACKSGDDHVQAAPAPAPAKTSTAGESAAEGAVDAALAREQPTGSPGSAPDPEEQVDITEAELEPLLPEWKTATRFDELYFDQGISENVVVIYCSPAKPVVAAAELATALRAVGFTKVEIHVEKIVGALRPGYAVSAVVGDSPDLVDGCVTGSRSVARLSYVKWKHSDHMPASEPPPPPMPQAFRDRK
jgi:hypothetical protein